VTSAQPARLEFPLRDPQLARLQGDPLPPTLVGAMVKLGGAIGAVLAVSILFVFTEWLYVDTFANHEVFDAVSFVLVAVAGAIAGSALMRRLIDRKTGPQQI